MAVSFFPTPTSSRGLSLLITAAVLAVSYLPTQSAFSPPLTAVHHGGCSLRQSVLRFSSKKLPTTSFPLLVNYNKNGDDGDGDEDSARPFKRPSDTLVVDTARKLQRISWLSWWSQIILTVTSAVILTFAKNVVTGVRDAQVNFFLAGSGTHIVFSSTQYSSRTV